MCGIVGYTGAGHAAHILLDGLERLEYRGYDSAGICVSDGEKSHMLKALRVKGRLQALRDATDNGDSVDGESGIGHTRWATHGEPTVENAHPHLSGGGKVAVVHNGIIENYADLRKTLEGRGYVFQSETDTETIAHLLDYYDKGDPIDAIVRTVMHLRGSFALGILFADRPGEVYGIRRDSPLIAATSESGNFIASDVPAILEWTRNVTYLDNMEIVCLKKDGISFYNMDGEKIEKEFTTVSWDIAAAEKGGYAHFMLKEIHEQPKAMADTIHPHVRDGRIVLDELGMTDEEIRAVRRIQMVACGSAWHVCMTAKYVMEQLAGIPVDVDLASEFRYRNPVLEEGTLLMVVSQSGETADSLAALRYGKAQGMLSLAIVNVVGSSIAREADRVFYTAAGPEIAVATTKAYSTQLAACDMLAIHFASVKGKLSEEEYHTLVDALLKLPEQISEILRGEARMQWLAGKYANTRDAFFIGRGLDYASVLEGALKLKEISYIHAEAYAAGELKHGTISLIEKGSMVLAVATQSELLEKEVSNIVEVHARGATLLALTFEGNYNMEDQADFTIYIPKTEDVLYPSLVVIPLQLLAYYVSLSRGIDVDKPRNLAKSVTVE
ncbi:MAG: glutamine--fructose-6-phosphate transaminase (isomerizing) [Clostridia bacterium]|nr:glutamine--fructose-6-phosphate transaminase (isomerizing) [Clostridia bacterium]MBR1683839.1 glutamine--fructose-6-phosphate transaminase (isomerizing) [Clostridia bacterium]